MIVNTIGKAIATVSIISVIALCGAFEPILLVFVAPAGMVTIGRIWVTEDTNFIESPPRRKQVPGSNNVTRWLRDVD